MHPAAITFWPAGRAAKTSEMTPTDSSRAAPRNPHVLTITTSASAALAGAIPRCWSRLSIPSESTRFLEQPSVMMWYRWGLDIAMGWYSLALAVVDVLEGDGQILGLERVNHRLQVVLALRLNADKVSLDLRGHLLEIV